MKERDIESRAARRPTVAVLAEHVLDEYQNKVLFGASDELRASGASVVVFCGGVLDSPDPTSAQRNAMYDWIDVERTDGIVVLSPLGNHIGPKALSSFCDRFFPLPLCSLSVELPGHPSVLVDNAGGMRQLIEHLVEVHRRRRVAFIRGPVGNEEAERRYQVYLDVLHGQGVAFDEGLVAIGDFNRPSGGLAVRVLCDERQREFDAVVAANDYMALGALEALAAKGIDVPKQVSVAGFDDIDEARFAAPALTTVRQPLYDSGRLAGRLVLSMLRGEAPPPRCVLETALVLRESCGCTGDHVTFDRAGVSGPSSSVADGLVARRGEIVAVTTEMLSSDYSRMASDWAEPLFDAFVADLRDGEGHRFIDSLGATLRKVVAAGGNIRPWHAVVAAFGKASVGSTRDPAGGFRADQLLHEASILIGDVRERVQAQHRIQRERWNRTLHETSEALMTAFGADALVCAVEQQLARLQIPACSVTVFGADPALGERQCKTLLLYDGGKRLQTSDDQAVDPGRVLAPAFWLDARARTLVAEPLVFRGEQLGFALFEVGPRDGAVYEGLRELVSSALKGARLVEQVVDEATRRQRAERERLEREMDIAARIQTTIVPKSIEVPGLEIAAAMVPATQVGGDYYDVVACEGGCWIGIGDVAGHGLQTGLVMLMIQSVVAALVRRNPRAAPADVLRVLNLVVYDNVHRRMGQDEHATLTLLRYDAPGRFVFAGAHEDIILHRASVAKCECVETRGPWVGAVPEIKKMIVETSLELESGDLMVLYTDGATEAKDARGLQFGLERLCAVIERVADQPVAGVRDHLVGAVRSWTASQDDDMSVVVIRRI